MPGDEFVAHVGGRAFRWFEGQRAVIHTRSGYRLIDTMGQWRSPPFQHAFSFGDGFFVTRVRRRWGLFDGEGQPVLDPIYATLGRVQNGLIGFSTADTYGLIDVAQRAPLWERPIDD